MSPPFPPTLRRPWWHWGLAVAPAAEAVAVTLLCAVLCDALFHSEFGGLGVWLFLGAGNALLAALACGALGYWWERDEPDRGRRFLQGAVAKGLLFLLINGVVAIAGFWLVLWGWDFLNRMGRT